MNNFIGKSDISTSIRPIHPETLYLLSKGTKGSREYYKTLLLQKSYNDNKLRHKWETLLNITVTEKMWQQCYLICFKTIQDNYLIWLQYRILNQILGIRNLKFKMGITQDNVCKLCNENEETLVHLFSQCEPTRKFWEDLSRKIKTNTNKEVDFSSKDIILGFQEKQMRPANILLIIMKKYIFIASEKEKNSTVSRSS